MGNHAYVETAWGYFGSDEYYAEQRRQQAERQRQQAALQREALTILPATIRIRGATLPPLRVGYTDALKDLHE